MNGIKDKNCCTSSNRIAYIDFMNIAACFGVICLHCSGGVFEYGSVSLRYWLWSMGVQTLAHFAVPVFFMITGTTLLEYRKKYDTKTFFKKRLLRTGVPFLFWTGFYLLLPVVLEGAPLPGPVEWRDAVFNNTANNVFWFFYAIFAIYLCIPAFSLIADEKNFKTVEYICLLAFCTTAVYPVITRFVMPVDGGIIPPFATGYVGYVFLGWLICHESYSKGMRRVIYIMGVCGALLMFFGTWCLSAQAGQIDEFFMQYHSIACFPMSAAIMLFAKHVDWNQIYRFIPEGVITQIASAGLGVYVVHMFFIILVNRYELPAYFAIVMPFVIYFLSLGTVLLLKKIPGLKKIIP